MSQTPNARPHPPYCRAVFFKSAPVQILPALAGDRGHGSGLPAVQYFALKDPSENAFYDLMLTKWTKYQILIDSKPAIEIIHPSLQATLCQFCLVEY